MITIVACGESGIRAMENLNINKHWDSNRVAIHLDRTIKLSNRYDKNIYLGDCIDKVLNSKGRMEISYHNEGVIQGRLSKYFINTEIAIVIGTIKDERDSTLIESTCRLISKMGILNLLMVSKEYNNDHLQDIIYKASLKSLSDSCSSMFQVNRKEFEDNVIQLANNFYELINFNGIFNLNVGDFYKIFNGGKSSYFTYATASGKDRSKKVVGEILSNVEIVRRLMVAENILINITGNKSLGLHEIKNITEVIYENINEEAGIVFGTLINDKYVEDIKVSLIIN
ncbi:hypothetical protein [Oceanirhabdus sp. W0125-5]|uniref:hypothetical protein n=1 Tax=Oceanirhabdus sp. W0125-5 TaxID=2999116 RepID=UPI0022F3262E|nr:hypothetical protein [Oceanirhabdus sp. W0125-5]WBW99334.1 hypothetical protein OW730_11485 [Oceanirhabdus sp. W0125-5]